ncbi:TPA: hypothetical protein F3L08_12970 [Aeromonas hydrophila]|nr:hypothetical protein [Aeromonas hydrophila]HAU4975628.1 hypothetical protein [Aeromonas hydrophila]HAU4984585.1 hypothetical protein [Aeromonas hydrophila]
MKRKMLSIADRYLTEIKFLIKKQGCGLSVINGAVYWVDSENNTSADSVSYPVYMELVSSGIICANLSGGLKVATPVYMLAIGIDPREYVDNLDAATASDVRRLEFERLIEEGCELDMNGWEGFIEAWRSDS